MWAPEGACKAKIEYLCAADGAIADSGITWGGQRCVSLQDSRGETADKTVKLELHLKRIRLRCQRHHVVDGSWGQQAGQPEPRSEFRGHGDL